MELGTNVWQETPELTLRLLLPSSRCTLLLQLLLLRLCELCGSLHLHEVRLKLTVGRPIAFLKFSQIVRICTLPFVSGVPFSDTIPSG